MSNISLVYPPSQFHQGLVVGIPRWFSWNPGIHPKNGRKELGENWGAQKTPKICGVILLGQWLNGLNFLGLHI